MTKHEKFLKRLMSGQADAEINFGELCSLLDHLGFQVRIRGSHHIFSKDGIAEIINLQPAKAKVKPYQVKQVRNLLRKYRLDKENE
ncbi:MAG: type II toxin-antitoxin system HicA family toxin [Chloroflexi bacterium]|nr:type II toxin-antitoxin system HicA family toxin [Chloroflexota bacterium]